jgi:protein-S-isoprenylcysteine O-methyltransferase Ste14
MRCDAAYVVESMVMSVFAILSCLGFKFNLWVVVWALAGHGLLDFVHARLIRNPGVPAWWPSFCLAYDLTAAGFLAWLLLNKSRSGNALAPESSAKPAGFALRVPPVAIVLIAASLMWAVSWALPQFGFSFPLRGVVAVAEAVLGVLVGVLGVASFRRVGTTVNPMKPDSASSLVETGIYRLTRNPMYLGLLLLLLGWGTFLANMLSFMWIPIFIGYMNRFQIVPEEKALASRFGGEFAVYKSQVRRWI